MPTLWQSFRNSLFPPKVRTTERRAIDRIPIPLCPNCRSRSDYAIYFECRHCGEQMVMNKPKGSRRL